MKNLKKLFAIVLTLSLVFSLCACGSAKTAGAYTTDYYSDMAAAAPMYVSEAAEAYDFGMNSEETPAESSLSAGGNNGGSSAANIDPEKIIYSADVTVETTAFDDAVAALAEFVERYGGFVESSSISGAKYYNQSRGKVTNRSASYTIRVPGKNFNSMLNSFTEMGNVPYTSTSSENISSQYYDKVTRLEALKTQEARLLELMTKAESVEDIITIEDRLSELRYQIERHQSTLNDWDRKVSYSTIYLSLNEVQEYTPEVEPGFLERLGDAFIDGITSAFDAVKEFILWFVEAAPTLIILALVFLFAVRPIWRSIKRKRAAAKSGKPELSFREKRALKAAEKKAKVQPEAPAAEAPAEEK